MSVMKDLATELEQYWHESTDSSQNQWLRQYSRTLPDGRLVTIRPFQCSYEVAIDDEGWGRPWDYMPDAMIAAGRIAREQLADMARTWTA